MLQHCCTVGRRATRKKSIASVSAHHLVRERFNLFKCLKETKANQRKEVRQKVFPELDKKKMAKAKKIFKLKCRSAKHGAVKLRWQQGAVRASSVSQEALRCFKFILKA